MLSYQHIYHVGNRADVLKHAVLDAVLRTLVLKRDNLLYLETHAGRGLYNLLAEATQKSGEYQQGIAHLNKWSPLPDSLADYLDTVRVFNTAPPALQSYPGSPAIAAHHLRAKDRMVLFDLHKQEYAALTHWAEHDTRIRTQKLDGYSHALKLAPRAWEQMLVFIDPSYETIRDLEQMADWIPRALTRWPKAMIAIWLPLFVDEREGDIGAYLASLEEGVVVGARWANSDPDANTQQSKGKSALAGSAMIVLRATQKLSAQLTQIGKDLQSYWDSQ